MKSSVTFSATLALRFASSLARLRDKVGESGTRGFIEWHACIALCACCVMPVPAMAAQTSYSFGVLSQRNVVKIAQYWNPILNYVSRKTEIKLDLSVESSGPKSNEATKNGDYDFVYSNNIFQPRMAQADYHVILRPLEEAITGQIVTLNDSPIHSLNDLAGQSLGFPSKGAFVGYALPMDHLLRSNISVIPEFGANQEGIMAQLEMGKVQAAAVNNLVMRDYASLHHLRYRVLWESASYLNIPIAAHPRVPQEVVTKVRQVLDDMDRNPEGLKILEQSARLIGQRPPYGFRASTPADYRNYSDFYRTTLVKDMQ